MEMFVFIGKKQIYLLKRWVAYSFRLHPVLNNVSVSVLIYYKKIKFVLFYGRRHDVLVEYLN